MGSGLLSASVPGHTHPISSRLGRVSASEADCRPLADCLALHVALCKLVPSLGLGIPTVSEKLAQEGREDPGHPRRQVPGDSPGPDSMWHLQGQPPSTQGHCLASSPCLRPFFLAGVGLWGCMPPSRRSDMVTPVSGTKMQNSGRTG